MGKARISAHRIMSSGECTPQPEHTHTRTKKCIYPFPVFLAPGAVRGTADRPPERCPEKYWKSVRLRSANFLRAPLGAGCHARPDGRGPRPLHLRWGWVGPQTHAIPSLKVERHFKECRGPGPQHQQKIILASLDLESSRQTPPKVEYPLFPHGGKI